MKIGNHFVCDICGKVYGYEDAKGFYHSRKGCKCSTQKWLESKVIMLRLEK